MHQTIYFIHSYSDCP